MDEEALGGLVAIGQRLVETAKQRGVAVAEAVVRQGSELSTKVRCRQPELVTEAVSRSAGLRLIEGQRVAVSSTNDLSAAGLQRLVDDAYELLRFSQADPFAGPPDSAELCDPQTLGDLELFDSGMLTWDASYCLEQATIAESAALDSDARIAQSEGASCDRVVGGSALVTSGGFVGAQRGTYGSLVVRPVADDVGGKKRAGGYWTARRHAAEMEASPSVGREAARRTLAKLGARKVTSEELPIVFDPDAGRSILGLLASCVNGAAIWRRSSYLADRIGTRVASAAVQIIDDPLIRRGPGSRLYDGEGLASRRNLVVEEGVLRCYLTDSYSGRKLSVPSTGSASRGASAGVGPSTSNFLLKPGPATPQSIVAGVSRGLYVTEMMGFGFNPVTGDFSRGAAGFWIESGELSFPVAEVTISLNLDALLQRIDAVGNDLDLRTSIAAPTFRVSAMTVAGS